MEPNEEEQEHIMALEQGEMMLLWQLHRSDMGQALQITTGPPAVRPSNLKEEDAESRVDKVLAANLHCLQACVCLPA